MNLFNYFRSSQRKTASVAKERLQIIVAHERNLCNSSTHNYLPMLQKDLLEVVRKYVFIEDDQISVHLDKEGEYEILELNITLPEPEKYKGG